MLIGEVIQRVISLYSKGVQTDESVLTPRHVYNKILSTRATLLMQKAKKRQLISTWSYQTLPCVEVIDVPLSECPCIPATSCKVKRVKHPLPKPISGILNNNIDWIISLDNTVRFDESNKSEMQHIKGNKYTSKGYRYIIDNGYAYLYGVNVPRVVQVRILCEDPMEAVQFPNTCGECPTCVDPFEVEFPIESGYIDILIEAAAKEIIGLFSTQKEDIKNDSIG